MDLIGELKAKVDFHKTLMTASLAAIMAAILGYWANYNQETTRMVFFIVFILFAVSVLVTLHYYVQRHKQLIREYRKR